VRENLYLDIGFQKQQQLVSCFKLKSGLTWTKFAEYLKINRSMALHYNRGANRLSLSNFTKLCSLVKVKPSCFGDLKLITINNKPKPVSIPQLDESLAEFLGFLAGDGCLTVNYSIVISCDATSDFRYMHEVVGPKFKQLFSVSPNFRKLNRNLLQCRLYSKKVFSFLSNELGFPTGKKKDRLRIPNFIFNNKVFGKAFLRGLFDTDGGFHRHNPFSAKVEITSHSKKFRQDIANLLIKLGFKPVTINTHVYIMSKAGIDLFFATIKPNNFKHSYKYIKFKQIGQVPRHRDIDYNSDEFKTFKFVFPEIG
jgi:intein/homing endonuclease